jgi:uncharacterized membrane protein
VYLLTRYLAPVWGVPIVCVAFGLISAGLFARLYVREPPSLERFRWLSAYGMACVAGLVLGMTIITARLIGESDARLRVRILMGSLVAVMVGLLVFAVWHALATQNYSRKPGNPDFEENAEGNPVQRQDRDETR